MSQSPPDFPTPAERGAAGHPTGEPAANAGPTASQGNAGDTLVVEAASAEEALGEVAARLGPNAEILSVEKVHRGGIGGFFARELVQIQARRPSARTGETATGNGASGVERILSQLSRDADAQERSFRDTLRDHMEDLAAQAGESTPRVQSAPAGPAAAPAATAAGVGAGASPGLQERGSVRPPDAGPAPRPVGPAARATHVTVGEGSTPRQPTSAPHDRAADAPRAGEPPRAPAAASQPDDAVRARVPRLTPPTPVVLPDPSAPGTNVPGWSIENLQRLRLPALLVDACRDLDPRDDLAWVYAIGRCLTPLCRPLPAGDAAIVGPKANRLADLLEVPVVKFMEKPPRAGSFCVGLKDSEQHRNWLAWARATRWLHLVIGGEGWRDFLFDEPLAVSWVGEAHLPEAISLAAELGLVLGYGAGTSKSAPVVRANPVDIAFALRALMPRR